MAARCVKKAAAPVKAEAIKAEAVKAETVKTEVCLLYTSPSP